MRFRRSFSAVCYHFGPDAVRPKRAETTLQIYTFFYIQEVVEIYFINNMTIFAQNKSPNLCPSTSMNNTSSRSRIQRRAATTSTKWLWKLGEK